MISPTITTTTGVCKIMNEEQMKPGLIVAKHCEIAHEEKQKESNPTDEWCEEIDMDGVKGLKIKGLENDESLSVDDYLYKDFGIFKLTPRECLRLMAVRDSDIDKMMSVNSNTQCYKQAGNSIVVTVLMAIFSQLNIKGVTPWNELTQDQRETIIERTR